MGRFARSAVLWWWIIGIIMNPEQAISQQYPVQIWGWMSLKGGIALEGLYRHQKTELRRGFREVLEYSSLQALLKFASQSYILHPNFFKLDTQIQFRPGTQDYNYLVIPDRTETRTFGRYRLAGTFFQKKPVSLQLFRFYDRGLIHRENLSSLSSRRSSWGMVFRFRNRFAPFQITYSKNETYQKEIATQRVFFDARRNFQALLNASFSEKDSHTLSYSILRFRRRYFVPKIYVSEIRSLLMRNRFIFGKDNAHSLFLNWGWDNQYGRLPYDRRRAGANLSLSLPLGVNLGSAAQFFSYEQNNFRTTLHLINSYLRYQIYESLFLQGGYEYSRIRQSSFTELNYSRSFSADYRKKIPTGLFRLNYRIEVRRREKNAASSLLEIRNLELRFDEWDQIQLTEPYIDVNSIRVRDAEGNEYQWNVDYFIVLRGQITEIHRIPGGLIPPKGTVYIDYNAIQEPSYKYIARTQARGGNLSLFRNFLYVFYNRITNNFEPVSGFQPILRTVDRRLYGAQLTFKGLSLGYKVDDYASNLLPYFQESWEVNLSLRPRWSTLLAFNGAKRDYYLIDQDQHQKFIDFSGMFSHQISRNWSMEINASSRVQKGWGIDLDLNMLRGAIRGRIRQLHLTFSVEMYRRNFLGDKIDYRSYRLEIERKL
jgi:hypothetical protein